MLSAQAQTFTVLHTFTGAQDGGQPLAGLAIDGAGNLYGTASSRRQPRRQLSLLRLRHRVQVAETGAPAGYFRPYMLFRDHPMEAVPRGSHWPRRQSLRNDFGRWRGKLRALCQAVAARFSSCGLPATFCASISCPWNETVLHRFSGVDGDGGLANGNLVFDAARNIYGTTYQGGTYNYGIVYEMTHANGGWTENVLYSFDGRGSNGWGNPYSGVIFDQRWQSVWNNHLAESRRRWCGLPVNPLGIRLDGNCSSYLSVQSGGMRSARRFDL